MFIERKWQGKKKIKYLWGYEINIELHNSRPQQREWSWDSFVHSSMSSLGWSLSSQICQFVTSVPSLKCSWCSLNVICNGPSNGKASKNSWRGVSQVARYILCIRRWGLKGAIKKLESLVTGFAREAVSAEKGIASTKVRMMVCFSDLKKISTLAY